MTRDFAKKPRPAARSGTTSKTPGKRLDNSNRSGAPAWVWLLTGALLGALMVLLAHLAGITPQPGTQATTESPSGGEAPGTTPKPRFDFYTLLKENAVTVSPPPESVPTMTATPSSDEFILQVGSFKKLEDADRQRAELILLNLEAQVDTVTVRNGQTWHRVLVGPYQSSSSVAQARSVLASNNINPLLLKRKRQ